MKDKKNCTILTSFFVNFGNLNLYAFTIVKLIFRKPFCSRELLGQLVYIGYNSLFMILITSFSLGMVLCLQIGFSMETQVGFAPSLGWIISASLVREMGPVLTSLLIAGRIGSAIAAEIASMKITEQIDSLISLSVNPIQYLVVPRFLASLIAVPILVLIADVLGILGGCVIAHFGFSIHMLEYLEDVYLYITFFDVCGGLFKSFVFGGIIVIMASFRGFLAYGGTMGVGLATTKAVVGSSIAIIVLDYILNAVIIHVFRV